MDGKKKLQELVASVADSFPATVSADTIRSISDAYKAMEAENERLRALIAAGDDAHRSIVRESTTPPAMKDDLVDQCVRALEEADSAVSSYEDLANAVLAIARPAILEEAAAHLKALSDAMWEKADHVAPEGFEPPTAEERDSAVLAYDFQKAAECVLSLAHTTGQEGGR